MSLLSFIADRIIQRAKRTPYTHLSAGLDHTLDDPDEADYMERYWLFNAYERIDGKHVSPIGWLPSIRIHRIKKSDDDRALHDHPWKFVTVILKGGYYEVRPIYSDWYCFVGDSTEVVTQRYQSGESIKWHGPGSILVRRHTDFHRLIVPEGGEAWTMFCTGKYMHKWGFMHDGSKMIHTLYKAAFGKR